MDEPNTDVIQGTLDMLILRTLSLKPMHAFGIGKRVEQISRGVFKVNPGSLLTALQRLERDGLVESDETGEGGPQNGFRITAQGGEELAHWLRTPPDLSSPPRDELVIKVMVAFRMPDVDVHDVIQVHRRYLVELMQQWTRLKEDEANFDLGFALVVDAELFRLDSVIRWLDTADGRLKRAASEPPRPAAFPLPKLRRTVGVRR